MKKKREELKVMDMVTVTPEMDRHWFLCLSGYSGEQGLKKVRVVSRGKNPTYRVPYRNTHCAMVLKPEFKEFEVEKPSEEDFKGLLTQFKKHDSGEFGVGEVLPARNTTGADPEIFVEGEKGIIPAWEFLPEKKPGQLMFWDGAQAEVTPRGDSCLERLTKEIRSLLNNVLAEAKKKDKGAKFSLKNVVELSPPVLNTSDMKYIQLGCAPSLNIYNDRGKDIVNPRELVQRFAGGHLHYAGQFDASEVEETVRALDAILGIAGVSLAGEMDDPVRRQYYGLAGEFRLPKHGIEYRVLSNFWLIHPAITYMVMELFRVVIRLVQSGLFSRVWVSEENTVREVINNCDVKAARKLLLHNAKSLEALFRHTNFGGGSGARAVKLCAEAATYTVLNGVEKVVHYKSVEKNWGIRGEENAQWQTNYPTRWSEYVTSHPKYFAQDVKELVSV